MESNIAKFSCCQVDKTKQYTRVYYDKTKQYKLVRQISPLGAIEDLCHLDVASRPLIRNYDSRFDILILAKSYLSDVYPRGVGSI